RRCGAAFLRFEFSDISKKTKEPTMKPESGDDTGKPPRKVIPITPATPDPGELVSMFESEKKVYPRSISGVFARWRWALVFL
ncbi:hypothetical protein ACMYLL_23380, partial [Salmonella enterica subsp. enterica serovar Enteritidis]|uniref:hypothetical protein n=1 Tax=Salmonella enterica TaxID=28901 RepID=UPI0039E97111